MDSPRRAHAGSRLQAPKQEPRTRANSPMTPRRLKFEDECAPWAPRKLCPTLSVLITTLPSVCHALNLGQSFDEQAQAELLVLPSGIPNTSVGEYFHDHGMMVLDATAP